MSHVYSLGELYILICRTALYYKWAYIAEHKYSGCIRITHFYADHLDVRQLATKLHNSGLCELHKMIQNVPVCSPNNLMLLLHII